MKKRMLSALLALCMLMTVVAVAEPAEAPAAAAPVTYTHNGRVTLIDGACTDTPIGSIEDAAQVVDSVLASTMYLKLQCMEFLCSSVRIIRNSVRLSS